MSLNLDMGMTKIKIDEKGISYQFMDNQLKGYISWKVIEQAWCRCTEFLH